MCTSPLIAIKYGVDSSTGKAKIKLKRRIDFSLEDYYKRYGKDSVILLPCGTCSECILQRRREWSVRVEAECSCHKFNSFITLTYDDDHYPDYKTWRNDYKDFIKALRNDGHKVRYFGCGELGSQSKRRHLHIILFGFMPEDISYQGESESGEALYTSQYVSSIWRKGQVIVQFVGSGTGSYVAGYTSKKLGSTESFQFQSTRPGIGFLYAKKNAAKMLRYYKIYDDFGSFSIPRYFKKVLEDEGYQLPLDLIKEDNADLSLSEQYRHARLHGFSQLDFMTFYNRSFADNKLKQLVRGL